MRPGGVDLYAQGHHVRMLEQEKEIRNTACTPLLDQPALQVAGGRIGHDAEPANFERAHYSQFSMAFLTCCMKSSAVAPSITRWS